MRLLSLALSTLLLVTYQSHAASIPLSFGVTYSGTIGLPGESHTYLFSGTPGQRVLLDSQEVDGLQINATLLSPSGVVLHQRNDDYDSGPLVLTEPGPYTLRIDASGSITGNYRFRLLDFAMATPLTLGAALQGQLDPGLSCNLYQFSGT
ncbi:MAG TPA: hypothetical protein VHI52_02715, partial [Verrucomicrobiae bacterium]|nr:hypothetical protein [Verrucomicrobiae bacterium]